MTRKIIHCTLVHVESKTNTPRHFSIMLAKLAYYACKNAGFSKKIMLIFKHALLWLKKYLA
jgi:hypothetical protein